MHRSSLSSAALAFALAAAAAPAPCRAQPLPPVSEALDVAPVWSGHPVGFALRTRGDVQLVAFYDAARDMCVAQRRLDEREWTVQRLPSRLGWDSHNYVTLAVDRRDHLHVVGNMHGDPLVYFRSDRPLDVTTLAKVDEMVGARERRMTYPVFLTTEDGALVFRYRDGGSGNGDDVLNVYRERGRRWRRLVDEPLLSGRGKVNGYFSAPRQGPDGRFHVVGVWRDTPDCATNHDVSYARSDDLKTWRRADGRRVRLPLTPDTVDVVDPVPARGGVINGNVHLGFDQRERPVVTYHKYDDQGRTKIYAARFEGRGWVVRQVGDLGDYRWDFQGGGSIVFEVRLSAVRVVDDAHLAVDATFPGGARHWLLDAETMAVVGDAEPLAPSVPAKWREVESTFAGMQKRIAHDLGDAPDGVRFVLTWETLSQNRDRPRKGPLPEPSMLRVVALPAR